MPITVILHEATGTDAARVGTFIAGALRKKETVRVIVLRDGPLVPWVREVVGTDEVRVIEDDRFVTAVSFAERTKQAGALLQDDKSDVIYVNSVAASVFVAAAKASGRRVVLHVHEKLNELLNLLRMQATKPEIVGLADGIVVATDDLLIDLAEVFHTIGGKVLKLGNVVDARAIRTLAHQPTPPPMNSEGQCWKRTNRIAVGACGTASFPKGADIFFEAAAQAPELDFIWIGGWWPPDAPDNPVCGDFQRRRLPNFFITGATDNPYAHMQALSIVVLTSREDPHPLVLAEAAMLEVPIVAFSTTTAATGWLGRAAILCYGTPNPADIVRVLRALDPEDMRRREFNSSPGELAAEFDLDCKCDELCEFISGVRAETAVGTKT